MSFSFWRRHFPGKNTEADDASVVGDDASVVGDDALDRLVAEIAGLSVQEVVESDPPLQV